MVAPATTSQVENLATADDLAEVELSSVPFQHLGIGRVLLPVAVAALAILLHVALPNLQTSQPAGHLRVLLIGIFVVSVSLGVVALVWRRFGVRFSRRAPFLAGAIALITVWDLITLKCAVLRLPFFPGPDMVLTALVEDRVILATSTMHSLQRLMVGYLAGCTLGFITGLVLGWFHRIRFWGLPLLKIVGPAPATAFIPLALVRFTPFFASASIIALAAWFPVTLMTMSGIANAPLDLLNVAQTWGAGRRYLIFHVALPSALPTIFVGLFMALAASFVTLIAAETVGAKSGLGWYINWKHGWGDYARVYAALVIMALFCSSIMTVLFKIRDYFLAWQRGLIRW